MRVLCCLDCELPDDQPNGIGNAASSLMVSLRSQGFITCIIARAKSAGPRQEFCGIPTYRFQRQITGIPRLIKVVLRFRPDVIYSHGPTALPLPILLVLKCFKTLRVRHPKFIYHDHGSFPEHIGRLQKLFSSRLARMFLITPDEIITVSDTQRKRMLSNGLRDWLIQVVRNSVTSSAIRKKESYSTDLPIILSVGRMTFTKGLHNIAMALPQIVRRHGPFLWMHIGWRSSQPRAIEYHQYLLNLLRNSELLNMVRFRGDVPHSDVLNMYREAMFVLHPTLHEGQSLVLLEAMVSSTPIIVNDIPSCRELVTPYCGLLFQSDPESLAHSIIKSFTNIAESKKRGKRAAIRSNLFSPQRAGDQLVTILLRS